MIFSDILSKIVSGERPDVAEVSRLLHPAGEEERQQLFSAARHVKERYFGSKTFVYGFVYFSTHCQNSCSFCLYRHGNDHAVRYRKTPHEVLEIAARLRDDGVNLVDLTMGEDPFYRSYEGFNSLVEAVHHVHNSLDVPVMISPGTLPRAEIRKLGRAGADWYACYQETHNPDLFRSLRPGQDYQVRLYQKIWARECQMLTEEGIMVGAGEDANDLLLSLAEMARLNAQQVRVMTFVPQEGIPLKRAMAPSVDELTMIAVMRLIMPDRLIPASMDVEGLNGLAPRLEAGANIITSVIPSGTGLAGVAQHELGIDTGDRSVNAARVVVAKLGLSTATMADYHSWMDAHRPTVLGGS